jgi:diguanylate cyclase (GGDEF)-like protein
MEQARRSRKSAAVFFIDLDGFKQLNDSMGHAAGDGLLIEVGERLRSVVRSSDSVIRIGGDEFVVVMPGLSAPSDAGRCAYSLLTAVQAPMWIGEMLAPVTCSVGCAVFPGSATEIDDLLAKADQALYTAKSMGKNRFHIFAEGELPASRTRSKAQNEAHGIDIETSIA